MALSIATRIAVASSPPFRALSTLTAAVAMAQGISVAVPIATAHWVVSEIVAHGRVRRGYLRIGAQVRPISRCVKFHFELERQSVAQIVSGEEQLGSGR